MALGLVSSILVLGDITQLIVALVIIILSIIGSIVQSRQEAAKREQQKRKRPPKPAADEVEMLLREVREPVAEQPSRRAEERKPPRPAEVRRQAPPRRRESPRPLPPLPEGVAGEIVTAEVVAAQPGATGPAGSRLAQQAAQNFDRSVAEQASRRMESQIERARPAPPTSLPDIAGQTPVAVEPTFDAARAELPPAPEVVDAPFHPLSQVLLNTFATPEGMATAVILRDVIDRPEWRWKRQS